MAQVFVYGDSLQSCLVGIVVPDVEAVKAWAAQNSVTGTTMSDWIALPALKAAVQKDMEKVAKEGKVCLTCYYCVGSLACNTGFSVSFQRLSVTGIIRSVDTYACLNVSIRVCVCARACFGWL